MGLNGPAWDVYAVFSPEDRWGDAGPPAPSTWMHQLPESTGSRPEDRLDPLRFAQRWLDLLGSDATGAEALALKLHAAGNTLAQARLV